jgi:hypothetical protein
MKISKKEEDFRIYVENDNKQFISSSEVLRGERSIDKRIFFKVDLGEKVKWNMELTREEIKSLSELFIEVVKYL